MKARDSTVSNPSIDSDVEARRQAARLGRTISGYPAALRSVLALAKTPFYKGVLNDHICMKVEALAHDRGLFTREFQTEDQTDLQGYPYRCSETGRWFRRVIAADVRMKLFAELASSQGYLRELRAALKGTLTRAHVEGNVQRPNRSALKDVGDFPCASGPWVVQAELGFRTSSVLESRPEELNLAIVKRLMARTTSCADDIFGLGDRAQVSVLDWFCGPRGALAQIIDALHDPRVEVHLTEIEVFRDLVTRYALCVDEAGVAPRLVDEPGEWTFSGQESENHRRLRNVADFGAESSLWPSFQTVVFQMPPPGEGSGVNLRNLYKDQVGQEVRLFDPGRLGPRKWRTTLNIYLHLLPNLLSADGEGFLFLPAGIRRGRDYRSDPGLLKEVPQWLAAAGLETLNVYEVEERSPTNQPFVGLNRPTWILYAVRRHRVTP